MSPKHKSIDYSNNFLIILFSQVFQNSFEKVIQKKVLNFVKFFSRYFFEPGGPCPLTPGGGPFPIDIGAGADHPCP